MGIINCSYDTNHSLCTVIIESLMTDLYKSLCVLTACCLFLVGCNSDIEPESPSPTRQWKLPVRLLSHGSGESINADVADDEDKVVTVVLAGSPLSDYHGGTTATFGVQAFMGKKNFFFATNLNTADQAAVGANGSETAFNTLELNTSDYLRGYNGNDVKLPIPMTAALRDVESPAGAMAGIVTSFSQKDVKLVRTFSKVEVEIDASRAKTGALTAPFEITVTGVAVKNIPAKFSLGKAIDSYDLKHAQNATNYPYLDWTLTVPTPTTTTDWNVYKTSFYLPENFVSQPVFRAPDLNGMTYIEVKYSVQKMQYPGPTPVGPPVTGTAQYRIAGSLLDASDYGKVMRNHAYKCKIYLAKKSEDHMPNGVLN